MPEMQKNVFVNVQCSFLFHEKASCNMNKAIKNVFSFVKYFRALHDAIIIVVQLTTMLQHIFRIGQFLFFSDNLVYSLSKNAWYPNLWLPCGGIWSNSIMLSSMDKYSSRGLVFFHLRPISFELLVFIT